MKRFIKLLQPHLVRPMVFSIGQKLLLGVCAALLWSRFVDPRRGLENGFFFLAVYFFLWAWFQYLAFDGMHPLKPFFSDRGAEPSSPYRGNDLKSLISQSVDALADLEEDEKTVVRLCADLIAGLVFLAAYFVI